MFNVKAKLEEKGHEVVPFSVRSDKNLETEYSPYFVSPIGGDDQVYFEDYKKTPKTVFQLLSRSFYSLKVKSLIKKIIRETNPDVVYILHFINKLSPSVIKGAKEMGKRVVVRLSDYFLLCPRFDFMYESQVCEDCLTSGYMSCVKKKCVKDSTMASLIRVLSMGLHRMMGVYNHVEAFVCPSAFMKNKLLENGFPSAKVHNIITFTPDLEFNSDIIGTYGLYLGRIAIEKGVRSLIEAYSKLDSNHILYVVADTDTPEAQELISMVKEKQMTNIVFKGFVSGEKLHEIIRAARFVCVPSIWYENIPNSVLEAHSAAKPVLCSNIGSMTELISDGYNGLLFEPNNPDDIARCVRRLDDDALVLEMSRGARRSFEERYTADVHYDRLVQLLRGNNESKGENISG